MFCVPVSGWFLWLVKFWDLSGMRQTTFVTRFRNPVACRGVCGLSGWLFDGKSGAEANNEGKQK